MFVKRITKFMWHHKFLQNLLLRIKDIDEVYYIYQVLTHRKDKIDPLKVEKFHQFCQSHQVELKKVYDLLEDDFSKQVFQRVLEYRCFTNKKSMKLLKTVYSNPPYFQRDIFGPVPNEVFVDGGAYTGDTVMKLFKYFGGGKITVRKYISGNLIPLI